MAKKQWAFIIRLIYCLFYQLINVFSSFSIHLPTKHDASLDSTVTYGYLLQKLS